MSFTAKQKQEVVRRAAHYMAASGLTQLDMASRLNLSRSTLNLFLNDHYTRDNEAICTALVGYMDENPLEATIKPKGKLHETKNVSLIRHCFTRAMNMHCAYYFRGAPGCQKTFVLEHLIAEIEREEIVKETRERRAYLIRCRIGIKPCDLMKRIARAAGVPSVGNTDRIINNLRHQMRNGQNLLVFDEAQFLSIECLETVRELLDLGVVGLLFAGSHHLESIFDRLDMAQWRSRIRKGEGLPGISEEEARDILKAELPKITESSMAAIINKSYEIDLYRGDKRKYISARLLFWSIEEIKRRKQQLDEPRVQ